LFKRKISKSLNKINKYFDLLGVIFTFAHPHEQDLLREELSFF